MAASVENRQNLITYLPCSCNSSLLGLLSEVTVFNISLKLSAACAHEWKSAMLNVCKTGGDPAALTQFCLLAVTAWVLVRPEECNSSLFPSRESRTLFSASLGSLTGSIALQRALPRWQPVGRLCGQRLLPAGLWEWIKLSLENSTARKSSFVIQWWQPLNISFVELHLENSLEKVCTASWFLSSH